MALTAKKISRLVSKQAIGRHHDQHGLYLQLASAGAASWIYRFEHAGRERMLGLGPLWAVSLKQAREKARQAKQSLLAGVDPVEQRKQQKIAARLERGRSVTFAEAARSYHEANQPKWRSAQHAAEWIGSLERHVFSSIGTLPVGAISTPEVMRVLEGLWKTHPESAARIRGRIETTLNWATASGLRDSNIANPAAWDRLKFLLPARKSTDVEHFKALPFGQVPELMRRLRERDDMPSRALQFTILCAARSGETLHAIWDEIKGDVWEIPATRMKSGKTHRVPLSKQAIALLPPRQRGNPHVFIGRLAGRGLGKDALERALARAGYPDVTVHGTARSAFADFAHETTAFPKVVIDMALGHTVSDAVDAAYRRGELFEKRRKLAQAWAAYCHSPPVGVSEATPLRKAARSS
jgi:integrase